MIKLLFALSVLSCVLVCFFRGGFVCGGETFFFAIPLTLMAYQYQYHREDVERRYAEKMNRENEWKEKNLKKI